MSRQLSSRRATPARASLALLILAITACSDNVGTGLIPTDPELARASATVATSSVLVNAALWVDPNSEARQTADAWYATRPADANMLYKIGDAPHVAWFGNWNPNVRADVDAATTRITRAGKLPVFVAYNVPQRDCGGLSGGNTTSSASYRTWIRAFANGIAGRRATVILEPDALAGMDCLSPADQQNRLALLTYAVQTLRASTKTAVYIDAGNPAWQTAETGARARCRRSPCAPRSTPWGRAGRLPCRRTSRPTPRTRTPWSTRPTRPSRRAPPQ